MPGLLLCDDAVAFSVLFRHWMRDGGFEDIWHATTGEEALAMAREHEPEVIVVDHLLPDMGSADLVPLLREAAPQARLMLISSLPAHALAQAAEQAEVDAYLSKAAGADDMRGALGALLGLAERRE